MPYNFKSDSLILLEFIFNHYNNNNNGHKIIISLYLSDSYYMPGTVEGHSNDSHCWSLEPVMGKS